MPVVRIDFRLIEVGRPTDVASAALPVRGAFTFVFISVLLFSCNVTATFTGGSSSVDLTFSVSTPTYQTITFSPAEITVIRGETLEIATTNTDLTGVSGWRWYVDDELASAQTGSTFTWDTSGRQPGEYIVSADVRCDGVGYSGSLFVTVTY